MSRRPQIVPSFAFYAFWWPLLAAKWWVEYLEELSREDR